ncbi:LysR family transcriptional regulator [Sphingosinicella sp. BN140058]|uniref:LysR family transcriptional regulator n=1 Tax=Sphingosinicella sp. BN140058 TaxID=1892855 RepID=UPI0010112B1C|nr:LysR family transcriptional regulator [Sphingosinicella sp. BN140058]QAY76501.1 LysR family transcriptional regulator [Sphingosinicella sp. BN140058]
MPGILMERSGEMEVFTRVVIDGGFSAAARRLDLTPSAVSKLIARLERRLGTRLLIRTTRALTLTEEGRAFFEAAQRIVGEIAAAEAAASGGVVAGTLAINASLPFGRLIVAPAVPSFLRAHPGVSVSLSFTDDVVDLMAERADIAIRTGALPDSALVARKLGQSPLVVVAAPAYLKRNGSPAVPADLACHDCLGFNFRKARGGWPMKVGGEIVQVPVGGSVRVNNGETLRQMALEGVGIARLGRFHVAEDLARGDLVLLLAGFDPGDVEPVHAIHVGGGPTPPRVTAFIDHLAAAVRTSALFR